MYLRTTKRKNKDGSVTAYLQLAHNERHPITKKPTAKIIHNFGRIDQLDLEAMKRLCKSIAKACNLKVIDPEEQNDNDGQNNKTETQFLKYVKFINTVALGSVAVIEALWERLGIKKTLQDIMRKGNITVPYERALLAMVANRLCEPESKLGVWHRWLSRVYLPSCQDLSLEQMYEAMDFFYTHQVDVERSIFFHIANLLNLEVDLIFYDTTTAAFCIDREDAGEFEGLSGEASEQESESIDGDKEGGRFKGGLRRFGRSKGGGWRVQVVVALAVTREGLPVRSWVFPGNTSDVETVKRVRSDLRGWKLGRALFVADGGMNSQDNRRELARACGKYLLASRMGSVSEIRQEVLSKKGRYRVIKENLQAKEVILGDGERRKRYIVCYNPSEAVRQSKHRAEVVKRLESELAIHADHKATSQWAIELLASSRYKRYLKITKGGKIRIDRGSIREAVRLDGKWVIETNDDTINFEDAACGYKGLMVIEQCFRSLKSAQIKLTPMYHRVARRIESHIKICVLALLIQRVSELACGKSWSQIGELLDKLQVTKCQTATHIFFKRNEVSKEVRETFEKLEIPIPKSVLGISPIPKKQSQE